MQLNHPGAVPAVPTGLDIQPRNLCLHPPYLGFLINTSSSSTECSREKGGDRVSRRQHGPTQHKGLRTGHPSLLPPHQHPGHHRVPTHGPQHTQGPHSPTRPAPNTGITRGHHGHSPVPPRPTAADGSMQPQTRRDLRPSVPVSRASLRKERDWEVPVRGCQSSASSNSRSLPGSHAGVVGGSRGCGGCLRATGGSSTGSDLTLALPNWQHCPRAL